MKTNQLFQVMEEGEEEVGWISKHLDPIYSEM